MFERVFNFIRYFLDENRYGIGISRLLLCFVINHVIICERSVVPVYPRHKWTRWSRIRAHIYANIHGHTHTHDIAIVSSVYLLHVRWPIVYYLGIVVGSHRRYLCCYPFVPFKFKCYPNGRLCDQGFREFSANLGIFSTKILLFTRFRACN